MWKLRTSVKQTSEKIVLKFYNLVVNEDDIKEWRTKEGRGEEDIDDEEIEALIRKERAVKLIGTPKEKSSLFIYGKDRTVRLSLMFIAKVFALIGFTLRRTSPVESLFITLR